MQDFWFIWKNNTPNFQNWAFLDSGNYFELPPVSSRTEQNQCDLGDKISIIINNKLRVTLTLIGTGWLLDRPAAAHFQLTQDPSKKTVTLTCISTTAPE